MRRLLVALIPIALVGAGCAPFVTPPGPAPLRYRDAIYSDVTATHDITYGSAVDQSGTTVTLKLDSYVPTGDTTTMRPAIVWVHGGSFCCGDKTSPELIDQATTFAQKGYVNVSINYRLLPSGCSAGGGVSGGCIKEIIDATDDAQAAVRFLRANATAYGIDASRIAIGGSSAGAIVAMNVAFDSADPGTSGNPGYSSAVGAAMALSGARLVGNVDAHGAPTLLFHGTADPLVPYAWAVATQADATAAGLQSFLVTWDGEGHVPYLQHRSEILDEETNFMFWELDLTNAGTAKT